MSHGNGDPELGRAIEREMAKHPRVPMPEQEPPPNPERDVMVNAAAAYDRAQRERDQLRDQLARATLAIEAKNDQIMKLEADLAEERNRGNSYRAERDQAVADRAEVEAFLASIRGAITHLQTELDRFELPMPVKRGRPRRNGVHSSSSGYTGVPGGHVGEVPDAGGSPDPVAR